jgi:hypothetical protein
VHNAHPHFTTARDRQQRQRRPVSVVHNGIIENHEELLRRTVGAKGYEFTQPDRHRGHRPPAAFDLVDSGEAVRRGQQAVRQLRAPTPSP